MFYSRLNQLRAILLGIVIADALAQRELFWLTGLSSPQAAEWAISADRSSHRLKDEGGDGVGNDWRHRTVRLLAADAAEREPSACDGGKSMSPDGFPAPSILTMLPAFLASLELSEAAFCSWLDHHRAEGVAPSILAVCQGARALLAANLDQAYQAWHQCEQTQSPTLPGGSHLSLAFRRVFAAQGNFELTIGQSLNQGQLAPSLLIPSGLLSACWRGLPGIPLRWHQALVNPSPELQAWLRRSWRLEDVGLLEIWATNLWHRWLGTYTPASICPPRPPRSVVQGG